MTQVGAGEIGAGQVDAAEVEVAQVGAAQVGLGAARAGLQAAAGDDADVDQRLAVRLSQLGSLNTQKEPPWATGRVRSAMSPPHSGTAPP